MARFVHLAGRVSYQRAHALQRSLLAARIAGEAPDTVLLLEHDPVITVGRRQHAADNVLQPGDVPVVPVERGGDVTWHGPGQLVAYPIVKLVGERADLHRHLHALEDAVISLIAELGLDPRRDARNTGVWLPDASGDNHKVCSIGIACRKWVTWHGLALNVDPDLGGFGRIHPCGFDAAVMTRLADHLAPCPSLDDLVEPLAHHLARTLDVPLQRLEEVAGPEALVPG